MSAHQADATESPVEGPSASSERAPPSGLAALAGWSIDWEGSTRIAGLVRILLAMILWARFGRDSILFHDLSLGGLACSLAFYTTTSAMLIGLHARASTAAAGFVTLYMVYVVGPASFEPWTHHHTTLLAHAVLLCALTPCDRSYSIDRWRALQRSERDGRPAPSEWGPLWGVRLLQIQLAVVYLFTTYDKLSFGFLSGARLQHYVGRFYTGSVLPTGAWFDSACAAAAVLTVLLEAALAVGLFFPRARRLLLTLGVMLHAMFYVTLDVWTYTATIYVLYLTFLEPADIDRAIDRLQGHAPL